MTNYELGWIVALFEGEGCISRMRQGWQAELKMTDEDVVRKFTDIIGIGAVHGPYPERNRPQIKPYWSWHIGKRQDVLNFVALFAPLMGTRRANKMTECFNDLVR
jgi:hypothetical protein